MTSSNGNIFRVTGHLCGEFTGRRWISRTKTSEAEHLHAFFELRLNKGWVNNREAGDLGHNRAHYDVIVMDIQYMRYMYIYTLPEEQLWVIIHGWLVIFRGWLSLALRSSSPSAVYMREWTGSALVQVMAPVRRQTITWTNADLLSVGPLGTKSEKFKATY